MDIEVNKIVILGNNEKYLVIDKVFNNDKFYYYVAEVNDEETDIKDNYKIVTIDLEDDQNCFNEVLGEEKLKEVLPLFLNNIKNKEQINNNL